MQTIWITGGSSGIGFATAKEFLGNNWQVIISSSSEEIKPDYEAAFTLYDNGVINNLSLDYQRFEVKTQLVNLKYINTNC